ncbi:MAG TPA: ribosomal-processing cysteine protease Prp [Bacillota bacterium]|nr:ribosomal-processing cysteine protease Prp [Bacillota bacterium]
MVIVNVCKKGNEIEEITISGHAESGPAGYDLVCAGVSAVSFGAINAVYRLANVKLIIEQRKEGGYLHISFPEGLTQSQWEKAQLQLRSMIVSLQTIEEQYSDYIQVKIT